MFDQPYREPRRSSAGTSASGAATTALLVVFVTLKLLEIDPVAGWSWWWVTSPLWGSIAFAAVGLGAVWAYFTARRWYGARTRARFEDASR